MESWFTTKNQVFCNDYNVSTLFRNLLLLFNVQGSYHSPNTLPIMIHYSFCFIILQLPSSAQILSTTRLID